MTPISFRPTGDKILVLRNQSIQRFGSIIAPDVAQKRSQEGTVIAVGSGDRDKRGKRIPLDLSPGDKVLFGVHDGIPVEFDGTEYLILRESEITVALTTS